MALESWSCQKCTFRHEYAAYRCNMCNALREAVELYPSNPHMPIPMPMPMPMRGDIVETGGNKNIQGFANESSFEVGVRGGIPKAQPMPPAILFVNNPYSKKNNQSNAGIVNNPYKKSTQLQQPRSSIDVVGMNGGIMHFSNGRQQVQEKQQLQHQQPSPPPQQQKQQHQLHHSFSKQCNASYMENYRPGRSNAVSSQAQAQQQQTVRPPTSSYFLPAQRNPSSMGNSSYRQGSLPFIAKE